jgi:hypothetical protein
VEELKGIKRRRTKLRFSSEIRTEDKKHRGGRKQRGIELRFSSKPKTRIGKEKEERYLEAARIEQQFFLSVDDSPRVANGNGSIYFLEIHPEEDISDKCGVAPMIPILYRPWVKAVRMPKRRNRTKDEGGGTRERPGRPREEQGGRGTREGQGRGGDSGTREGRGMEKVMRDKREEGLT